MTADRRARMGPRWGAATVGVSSLLLASIGGAVVAAPVTPPLLRLTLRPSAPWFRALTVLVATLAVAEVTWAAYGAAEEGQPWIGLLPLTGGLAGVGIFATVRPGLCPGEA